MSGEDGEEMSGEASEDATGVKGTLVHHERTGRLTCRRFQAPPQGRSNWTAGWRPRAGSRGGPGLGRRPSPWATQCQSLRRRSSRSARHDSGDCDIGGSRARARLGSLSKATT
jgi:hypothetical protein